MFNCSYAIGNIRVLELTVKQIIKIDKSEKDQSFIMFKKKKNIGF